MGTPNGLRPARLKVGIISAGRVGTALGVALERAEHVVVACSAISRASRQRAERRLPDTPCCPSTRSPPCRSAAAGRARRRTRGPGRRAWPPPGRCGRAPSSCTRPAPTASRVLAPLTEQGCVPLAIHPAMTFTGADEDIVRLSEACFGITAADEVGYAIAQSLVLEIGGEPFRVREDARPLYHAALAHAGNHVITVVARRRGGAARRAVGAGTARPGTGRRRARRHRRAGDRARWPARRWRTRCSAVRARSPDRSRAVTPPRSPATCGACRSGSRTGAGISGEFAANRAAGPRPRRRVRRAGRRRRRAP